MLNTDIVYAILHQLGPIRLRENRQAIENLSLSCRSLRATCLPVLFEEVYWPQYHGDPDDRDAELSMIPGHLLPCVRKFHLHWPVEWSEGGMESCRFGKRYIEDGDYDAHYLSKLEDALDDMTALSSISFACPFFIHRRLWNRLLSVPTLRAVAIRDTLLHFFDSFQPNLTPRIERFTAVPVREASRVGEGPIDPRSYYEAPDYFDKPHRKKYWERYERFAKEGSEILLKNVVKPSDSLSYLQISSALCSFDELYMFDFPKLVTLIYTGPLPIAEGGSVLRMLEKMPVLKDLRLLFTQCNNSTNPQEFQIIPRDDTDPSPACTSVLSGLRSLSVSKSVKISNVFHFTPSVRQLAVIAVSQYPSVPMALKREAIEKMLNDLRDSHVHLTRLRLMLEDRIDPTLCALIADALPELQDLELEILGYHDGRTLFQWNQFAEALSPLTSLHALRLCIPFAEFDEQDDYEWRNARRDCVQQMASALPSLDTVGFQYRHRVGVHQFEDDWVDWDVYRNEGGVDRLELCPRTWYPFPEVWKREVLV